MTRGTKRGGSEATGPRATKVAKTDSSSKNASKKAALRKHVPSAEVFKAKALPLHVNITHTPPATQKEGEIDATDSEKDPAAGGTPDDVGLIGKLTLVPSTFSTGSYGWKGNQRIVVEFQGSEDGEGGKERVQVMLSINATVLGSKPPKASRKEGKASNADQVPDAEGEADEEDASEEQ